MKIYNIRHGFATNSSSSHSIVVGGGSLYDVDVDGDFGWNNFVAASPESKLRWFASHFNSSSEPVPNEFDQLKKELFGFDDATLDEYKDDYVDHQSNFYFSNYQITPDFKSFILDFKNYILRDDVAIYGGNDNTDIDFAPEDAEKFEKMDRFTDLGSSVHVKVKKEGDFYSIMNSETGFKIRVSFSDNPVWDKAESPELVDLKISDYCPYGCSFCYQGSTKEGKHAPLNQVKAIIDVLADSGVFEVAIGGGEPTEHPNFVEILEYCDQKGVIPNFTTFSTKWLSDQKIVSAVSSLCKGVGVSIHDAKHISKLAKIKEALNAGTYGCRVNVMAQHVVGSMSTGELFEIVQACIDTRTQLLLLGFKETGFGNGGPKFNIDPKELGTIIQIMKDSSKKNHLWFQEGNNPRAYLPISLSIDTQIISLYKDILEECSINPILLSSPEGKFSCYWDAVENTVAKSSYCDDDEFFTVDEISTDNFKSIFRKF